LAFTITYDVKSLAGTQFTYPSAPGCIGQSSVSSSSDVCVIVFDAFGTSLPENIQGATYGLGVNFSFSPTSPQIGQTVTFTPRVTTGTSPFSYSWTFGDGSSSNLTSPSHIYAKSGPFNVTLTVTDSSVPPRGTTAVHTITVLAPDFIVSATPLMVGPLPPGIVGHSDINVTGISRFAGTVTLLIGPSRGLAVSLSANNLTLSPGNELNIVIISVSAMSPGAYSVPITCLSKGLMHSFTVIVDVGDFVVSGPTVINLFPSVANATSSVRVSSLFGFNSTVVLTPTSQPGLIAKISPSQIATSGVAVLTVSGSPGTYSLVITGSATGFLSHSISVAVNIGVDFKVSVSPVTSPIAPNTLATSTITVTSINGFTGTINLALIPSAGLVITLTSTSITLSAKHPATSTLTVEAGVAGNYSLTIVASSQGLPNHTATLGVTVKNQATPAPTGSSATSVVDFSIANVLMSLSRNLLISTASLGCLITIAVVMTFKSRKRR